MPTADDYYDSVVPIIFDERAQKARSMKDPVGRSARGIIHHAVPAHDGDEEIWIANCQQHYQFMHRLGELQDLSLNPNREQYLRVDGCRNCFPQYQGVERFG